MDEVLEQFDVTREQIHAMLGIRGPQLLLKHARAGGQLRNQPPLPTRGLPRSRLQNRLYPNLQDWQFFA
jgi:hypothetical protein